MVSLACEEEVEASKKAFDAYEKAEEEMKESREELKEEYIWLLILRDIYDLAENEPDRFEDAERIKEEYEEKIKEQKEVVAEKAKIFFDETLPAFYEAEDNFFDATEAAKECLESLIICKGCTEEFKPECITTCESCLRDYCDTCFDPAIEEWELKQKEKENV